MTPTRVDEILKGYNEAVGRCGHLKTEMRVIERDINIEIANMLDTMASPKPQRYSDMPHGTQISNPTEQLGIMLAEGYKTDYQRELEGKLAALEAKYDKVHVMIEYVDSWLSGLNEKDRFIVESQVINQVSWREVVNQYRDRFKESFSKDTLKRIKDKALLKIYKMAE